MATHCDNCKGYIGPAMPRVVQPSSMHGIDDWVYHVYCYGKERKAENSNPSAEERPSG